MIIRRSLIKLLIALAVVVVATALLTTSQRRSARPARREALDTLEVRSLLRAKFMLEDGKCDEALRICSAVLKNAPDSVDARQVMADALLMKGDRAGAEGVLREALLLSPDRASLHRKLASALFLGGRSESALRALKKSYALDPASPATLLMLCDYYGSIRNEAELRRYEEELGKIRNPVEP